MITLGEGITTCPNRHDPWHLRWSATEADVRKVLPGDELVPQPVGERTRAIMINAPAEPIWPRLVQLGQGRGG